MVIANVYADVVRAEDAETVRTTIDQDADGTLALLFVDNSISQGSESGFWNGIVTSINHIFSGEDQANAQQQQINSIEQDISDEVTLIQIDVGSNEGLREIQESYDVTTVPFLIVFKRGIVVLKEVPTHETHDKILQVLNVNPAAVHEDEGTDEIVVGDEPAVSSSAPDSESVTIPEESIELAEESVDLPEESVDIPEESIELAEESVDLPEESVEEPIGVSEEPEVEPTPVEEPTVEPEVVEEEPIVEPLVDTVIEPIVDTVNDTIQEAINDTISEPINDTVSEAINDTISELINDTISEPANETIEEPSNATVGGVIKDTIKGLFNFSSGEPETPAPEETPTPVETVTEPAVVNPATPVNTRKITLAPGDKQTQPTAEQPHENPDDREKYVDHRCRDVTTYDDAAAGDWRASAGYISELEDYEIPEDWWRNGYSPIAEPDKPEQETEEEPAPVVTEPVLQPVPENITSLVIDTILTNLTTQEPGANETTTVNVTAPANVTTPVNVTIPPKVNITTMIRPPVAPVIQTRPVAHNYTVAPHVVNVSAPVAPHVVNVSAPVAGINVTQYQGSVHYQTAPHYQGAVHYPGAVQYANIGYQTVRPSTQYVAAPTISYNTTTYKTVNTTKAAPTVQYSGYSYAQTRPVGVYTSNVTTGIKYTNATAGVVSSKLVNATATNRTVKASAPVQYQTSHVNYGYRPTEITARPYSTVQSSYRPHGYTIPSYGYMTNTTIAKPSNVTKASTAPKPKATTTAKPSNITSKTTTKPTTTAKPATAAKPDTAAKPATAAKPKPKPTATTAKPATTTAKPKPSTSTKPASTSTTKPKPANTTKPAPKPTPKPKRR